MEAFVLAAGLGSRLRPLTNDRPKALVEINGKTLLEINLLKIAAYGVKHCVVNVHYMADMLVRYIEEREWPMKVTISDERELLLDTGGALKHAASLFSGNEPVLIHNVDVLSDLDLTDLYDFHCHKGNLVTLFASDRDSKRKLLFDTMGRLRGRSGNVEGRDLTPLAFNGISIVNPDLFDLLPEDDHPYPIIDCYVELSKTHTIGCYTTSCQWLDVGTPEAVEKAKKIWK
ncbi:MAG: nucleotidyltransferase family protein [Bacteroidales bacterium]|nr:nucleotidyltransferase family protein [Bacteroidales bacterium]